MVSQNIIPRGRVIPGATNDNYHPDGESHCLRTQPAIDTITLTNAQVMGLNHTPVEVVAAIPGKRIRVLGVYYQKASGAYTGGNAMVIEYQSNMQWVVAIDNAVLRSATAEVGWGDRRDQSGTPESQSIPFGGMQIASAGGFQGSGGGDLEIDVVFVEVD